MNEGLMNDDKIIANAIQKLQETPEQIRQSLLIQDMVANEVKSMWESGEAQKYTVEKAVHIAWDRAWNKYRREIKE